MNLKHDSVNYVYVCLMIGASNFVSIVQLGPKLQSSTQVLAQSEHYIQGGIHHPPPPTANFLKDSKAKDYELTLLTPKLKSGPFPKQSQDQSLFQAL